ncbi:phage major capsid protein (plasmid) [Skermanella rosea]|uniref:phage major capsid protein n=1 Tax=Skermanella rosea TaxID=1817965 RepID=UPI0019325360|nr:phage major capsid protein [Skermanella rosea]UEM08072.1 phage major capsid protein [Skermanella rosea]
MKAATELKSMLEGVKKKTDALDEAKINAMIETATKTAEESQQLGRQFQASEKAHAEFVAGLEAKLKEAVDSGTATAKELVELKAAVERQALGGTKGSDAEEEKKAWNKAMNAFARKDVPSQTYMNDFLGGSAEYKDLSVNSQPDGGYLVMPVFDTLLRSRIIETSPIRELATVRQIGKDAIEFPTYNDVAATGGWVVEKASRPATATPKFGKQRIGAHEQYAEPVLTQKMIDDADIDIEAWLLDEVTAALSRAENTGFVSGDGNEKPRGLLTYPNYASAGVFEQGAIEQIKSGSNGAYTYDGLVDLQNSLKEDYQANARFMVKRRSFGGLMKLKDLEGRPIFNMVYDKNVGLETGIMGKPVSFADDMPVIANDALALAYGDFRRAYTVVDRIGVRILRDPLTAKGFVIMYVTKRVGGDVTNFEAVKLQKLAA